MKIKDVKNLLNKFSDKELEQDFLYNSESHCISGAVKSLTKAKSDLYYTGDDDPAKLYTKKQLKDELSYDAEEIEQCTVEIPKGAFYISF